MGWDDVIVVNGIVEEVKPGGAYALAGVIKGDRILPPDETKFSSFDYSEAVNPFMHWTPYSAGTPYTFTVERNHKEVQLTIKFKSLWSTDELFFIFYHGFLFLLIITGILVLLKDPTEKSTRIFYLFLILLTTNFHTRYLFIPGAAIPNLFFILTYPLHPVLLFHFIMVFPKRVELDKKFSRVLILMYAGGLLFSLLHAVSYLNYTFVVTAENNNLRDDTRIAANFWMGISTLFALIYSYLKYFRIKESYSKNQFRWIMTGLAFGVLLPMMFGLAQPIIIVNEELIWSRVPNLLLYINFITTPFMIVCFLFAIMKYKVWNIEIVIKKGLLYSGTTFSVIGIYFLIIYLSESFITESTGSSKLIGLTLAAFAFFPVREGLQKRVNKLFYREELDTSGAIFRFENNLLGIYEKERLHSFIVKEINKIFHFEYCALYMLRQETVFIRVSAENISTGENVEIAADKGLIKMMQKGRPFALNELNVKAGLPEFEIVTPLLAENNIPGFLICGRKKSHQTFTLQDINLLQLLAQRIISLLKTAELYRKEIERKVEMERERERISRDMHDEIGSSLTKISIISELLKKNLPGSGEINAQLEEISQSSRGTITNISEIIWAINPNYDSLEDLISYLNNYASGFLEGTRIKYLFCGPEVLPDLKLSSEQRRNVFLTVKEALNNALKYSEAVLITLEIEVSESSICIRIKDNGKGFCPNDKKTGNGLRNMRKRIEESGGDISIDSITGSGTIVQIVLAL
jgi:signal transduction histidine kinase